MKIDWNNLGFNYIKTNARYVARWKDGHWLPGELTKDNVLQIEEASPCLHYGQQCFEGLKAYRTVSGNIQLFRVEENAKRFKNSAQRLLMPDVPQDMFIDACIAVVKANKEFVPPYGTGGTLYLRPMLLGVGNSIAVKPADEFIFSVFCIPVGPYFKGGLTPVNFIVSDYDRAAANGTGKEKVGGNYAASMLAHKIAVEKGFADCIYLDPITHTKIEEVGAANFFGITHNNHFITPSSSSILPSITKYSLLTIAKELLKMPTHEEDVYISELNKFKEAGACGTAAVITPIGGIYYHNHLHVFHSEKVVGPITKSLYDILTSIQFGTGEDIFNWTTTVESV
ncbi:MAG: branched-chain amino acid aminotransferase [Eubacteriaceae bacterium]